MATYNGARFVREQLDSILAQLDESAEVIVVDDCSSDNTVQVVRQMRDVRIRIFKHPFRQGYVRAFEDALAQARGNYILLSDQDDVWPPGRVELMVAALRNQSVVAGNVALLESGEMLTSPLGRPGWRLTQNPRSHRRRVLLNLALSNEPYFGSAMGITRQLRDTALPFPPPVRELHDAWLALLGLVTDSICHVDDVVVLRRVHGGNASGTRREWWRVIRGRVYFVLMFFRARVRARATSARLLAHRRITRRPM